jgi:hypothetical protein
MLPSTDIRVEVENIRWKNGMLLTQINAEEMMTMMMITTITIIIITIMETMDTMDIERAIIGQL